MRNSQISPIPKHCYSATSINNNNNSGFGKRPQPSPFRLGDPKEQAEMEEAIKKVNEELQDLPLPSSLEKKQEHLMSEEELEQFYQQQQPSTSGSAQNKDGVNYYVDKDALAPFPNNTNPKTGEIGGPRGPEPTRYGDWERKGRVTDF
ncbi:hypothetical protein H4219_003712 [Mycoemilia scoparia]|uniref:Succinate dehydrogenase assembly factor 4, mitochondrial n=1 Tax=Mycoemilia scoparia TaxID=417184 RepID=A0A9W7ZUR0_9FUNG|nr:hypothetical protein H4219_003712 [Mycoemilia scoparia]